MVAKISVSSIGIFVLKWIGHFVPKNHSDIMRYMIKNQKQQIEYNQYL